MKYQAPYGSPGGPNDPTAVYINGNPSTGTMGSIPPAAAIENPQREIVNFEADSGLTPSDADLHQLSKSVQNGLVNYCTDAGTPNFLAITPTPAIAAYQLGQHFRIKATHANTGPTQVNVSNLGWKPLVHGDKTQMGSGEIFVGQIIDVAWDGANWQMMTGGLSGALIQMTAPRTVYVNAAIGSDTAYDGSQATVSADNLHGPFQTIMKALNVMVTYNLGGWTFNIVVADGLYGITSIMRMPRPNGSGTVALIGNHASPQNVQVYNTSQGSCFFFSTGGNWNIDGFSFHTTAAAPGDAGHCIWYAGGTALSIAAVAFGPCAGSHIAGTDGSTAYMVGPVTIWGAPVAYHVAVAANAIYNNYQQTPPNLTITTAVNCTAFASAAGGGYLQAIYGTITGAASMFGPKYSALGNGVIDVGGRGASYLPGSLAGSLATGGQLL